MSHLHWPTILLILLGLLLVTEAAASLAGHGLISTLYNSRTYHFIEVQPGVLYRDGMRNSLQFMRSVRRAGIHTVVSVIGKDEVTSDRFAPAMKECGDMGVRTECLGVKLGGWPDTDAIRKFLDIVADEKSRPVLVHCREGVRRTGMMVAAYQMSVLGYSKEQAKAAIEQFGHSERTVTDVQRFIELYDPANRSVMYDAEAQPAGLE